ncbi:penicillin-binding transpeptidase domain-containing protein [Lactococcus lactis]|uniref:penicillin-binding transpeptidase domain-containing protein n=1 Tax=Lactococcus lactis TaxID=1358 RepID=UPI0028933036|nr:penicillin-binding transpeptidase domain-containing protein [Lactococcus lactis]
MDNRRIKKNKNKQHKSSFKNKKILKNPITLIPKRINLLFFIIFILFMILIGKLFDMQVLHRKYYVEKSTSSGGEIQVVEESPRGNIYDATGKALASTVPVQAVEFTRSQNVTANEMYEIANKLSIVLSDENIDTNLTIRDKKDYYLADEKNLDKIANDLTEKEKKNKNGSDLTGSEIYEAELKRVTENDIKFTQQQVFAATLFKKMNSTSIFNTSIIATSSVTAEQQAIISEKESELSGITIGTSWDRVYAENSITPLLGTITSKQAGIPAEELDEYLKKGYQRDDRVGVGFLEKGYETELQGSHSIKKIIFDKNGKAKEPLSIQKGKKGNDLKLTVNSEFEDSVNNIVKTELDDLITKGYGKYNKGAYAVVLNVKTGAVLALSGYQRDPDTGTINRNILGTFQYVFTPGSVVKMGTLTAAWNAGAISGNETLTSQSIKLKGSNPINDWWGSSTPMPFTTVEALQNSSNTYMVQLAMRMLGAPYTTPGQYLDDTNRVKVYEQLRKAFSSYGLGVSTGFDIPGETTGYIPSSSSDAASGANVLYESFGQYDNYTPLQVAVYAATLANKGTRLSPHIVQGIYQARSDGSPGELIKNITPKIMDKVNITPDNMDVLHQGMYAVVHGSGSLTTGTSMKDASVSISAKTGTSEGLRTLPDGSSKILTANNAVAFAPSDDPEIAISVILPDDTEEDAFNGTKANQNIVKRITDLYYSNEAYRTN